MHRWVFLLLMVGLAAPAEANRSYQKGTRGSASQNAKRKSFRQKSTFGRYPGRQVLRRNKRKSTQNPRFRRPGQNPARRVKNSRTVARPRSRFFRIYNRARRAGKLGSRPPALAK